MAKFRIFETDQFVDDLDIEFKGGSDRVRRKLSEIVYPLLRKNLHYDKNIKKIKNYEPDTWRFSVGGKRFFYEIDEKERLVIMIAADAWDDRD